jgi:putative peptidoglycan lipid II flippase
MLRSGAIVSAMTMISRVLGLARDAIIFHFFPAGGALDAFFVAFRVPNLLRRMVAEGAFSLAFIPVLTEYKESRSREDLQKLLNHVAGTLSLVLFIITAIGMIAAPLLAIIFAPGFLIGEAAKGQDGSQANLTAHLLLITFPYIFMIALSAFVSAILNTFQKFAVPAFTPVLLNLALIASVIWWAPHFAQPVEALAWGVIIGGFLQLAFQLPTLIKLGLLPKPSFRRGHEGVKRIMKLMVPALLGSSVAQINILINTAIASMLAVGSISWLYASDRFVELPLAIIGVAIGIVILPKLSGDHINAKGEAFSQTLDWGIRLGLLVALPAMLGLMLLAKPILATVLANGANDWKLVEMASMSLITYSLGLPAFILVKVLAPGFYSRQDTKTPVRIGIIAVISNILLSALIVYPWYKIGMVGPHAGLALATTLAGYINAGMLFYQLKKQQIYQPLAKLKKAWIKDILRIVSAMIVMTTIVILINPADSWWQEAGLWQKIVRLVALVFTAIASYFFVLFLLGVRKKTFTN